MVFVVVIVVVPVLTSDTVTWIVESEVLVVSSVVVASSETVSQSVSVSHAVVVDVSVTLGDMSLLLAMPVETWLHQVEGEQEILTFDLYMLDWCCHMPGQDCSTANT